jgi:glycosyltransferase involved in cell wall biosynthesis
MVGGVLARAGRRAALSRRPAGFRARCIDAAPLTPLAAAPMKVLHIVENLNHGAVENWLVRMLRHGVVQGVPLDWTFYCAVGDKGAHDDEARRLGARVVHSPAPLRDNIAFLRALRRELRKGAYNVMHCHHDLVSAVYLLASIGLPIHKRIVHVHNADENVPSSNAVKAWLARPLLRGICLGMADHIVGISNHTLDTFLAGRSRRPDRDLVHYYGVDTAAFGGPRPDRVAFRRGLGLADDCRILLFAGRLVPEKNPLFAVEVFAQLHRLDPNTAAVFVGAGSLEPAIGQRVRELAVDPACHLLGWRDDAQAIMGCCDWLILPRPEQPMEGFGIAVVEAQLAGLKILMSRGVADDPLLPTACFRRVPLAQGPAGWAHEALALLNEPCATGAEARQALARSRMDMRNAFNDLARLHA